MSDTADRAPWPAAAYTRDAPRIGSAMHALVTTERRWVHRRVETIVVLGPETVRRSVSVALTVPTRIASRVALAHYLDHLVPIAVLSKAPLRNFDCRLGSVPVPVLGRDSNAQVAAALL